MRRLTPLPGTRGVTWFWGLMREGESGKALWERLPWASPDLKAQDIARWTKVTGGKEAAVILAVIKDGKGRAYSAYYDEGAILIPEAVDWN